MKTRSDIFDQIRTLSKEIIKISELSDQNTTTVKRLLNRYNLMSMDNTLLSYDS